MRDSAEMDNSDEFEAKISDVLPENKTRDRRNAVEDEGTEQVVDCDFLNGLIALRLQKVEANVDAKQNVNRQLELEQGHMIFHLAFRAIIQSLGSIIAPLVSLGKYPEDWHLEQAINDAEGDQEVPNLAEGPVLVD